MTDDEFVPVPCTGQKRARQCDTGPVAYAVALYVMRGTARDFKDDELGPMCFTHAEYEVDWRQSVGAITQGQLKPYVKPAETDDANVEDEDPWVMWSDGYPAEWIALPDRCLVKFRLPGGRWLVINTVGDDAIEITAEHGALSVFPRSSNLVHVRNPLS